MTTLTRIADAVIAVVLAPLCASCGELLTAPTAGPVCETCWSSIRRITPPLCEICGDPLATWRAVTSSSDRCPRCRRVQRPIDRARALAVYEGTMRNIIHALKYDGRRSLAPRVAALMCASAPDLLLGAAAAIPVPLHGSRQRHRGFNQAADLARHLRLPVRHALRRIRATAPQAGLPAARRHRNVRDAFKPTRAAQALADTVVVLVDDVTTTGATLDACARALKKAGIREVRALTAARAVTRAPL